MSWYKTGTISITSGASAAVGTGTLWASQIQDGDILLVSGLFLEVGVISDDTNFTLSTAYTGPDIVDATYAIISNWNRTTNATLAQKVASLLNTWITREEELTNWASGAVDGGADLDGMFPVTSLDGVVVSIPSPDKIATLAATGQIVVGAGAANAILKSNADGTSARSGWLIDTSDTMSGGSIGAHTLKIGAASTSGSKTTLDMSTGNFFCIDIGTEPFTSVDVKSTPSGVVVCGTLDIENSGAAPVTITSFPINSKWEGGSMPSIVVPSNGFVTISFYTKDGGLSYRFFTPILNGS